MLMVLSPAKKLDFDSPVRTTLHTEPVFPKQTAALVKIMQSLSANEIASLMRLSDSLSQLNADRYANWHADPGTKYARQAAIAFNGDVYEGLQAVGLSDKALQWSQSHLAILSGLYGVLRPLDLIQPYRLEMGTKLENKHGTNLYSFWGDAITKEINGRISASGGEKVLLNLASAEYFKSVNKKALDADLVECVFQDQKNGNWKIISFYAKKARGLMARFIIDNNINEISALKEFNVSGYKFVAGESTTNRLLFRRPEQ